MPRAFFLASTLALLAACGSSSPGGEGGAGGSGTTTSTTTTSTQSGPISSCMDINATPCFSNLDCSDSADRCENKGTADAPVACCVPGARGAGGADAPCTTENDCTTAVCIDTGTSMICSPECTSDNDCPADLSTCVAIDPSVGKGAYCAPG